MSKEQLTALHHFYDELVKAAMRVDGAEGNTPEDRARWLLRFANSPLTEKSDGDLDNLRYDIAWFERKSWDASRQQGVISTGDWPRKVTRKKIAGEQDLLPDRECIENLQQWVHSAISRILAREDLRVELDSFFLHLYPTSKGKGEDAWESMTGSESPATTFMYSAFQLLQRFADRIKECPECRIWFLADRSNQNFHIDKCQMRAATRRYRERKGLITGRKRGRPPLKKRTTPKRPKRQKGR